VNFTYFVFKRIKDSKCDRSNLLLQFCQIYLFSYSINLQILNNLFEIMKGVAEIISPYRLHQFSDFQICFFKNNLVDRVNRVN